MTALIKAIASYIKHKYFVTIQKGNLARLATHTEHAGLPYLSDTL